jgi:hypothetical protein
MKAAAPSPWPLLLSRLRLAAKAVITATELRTEGLDGETLLLAGVIERRRASQWRPPGCERHCMPNLDLDARTEEGLVGVACPHEPACWPGWQWVAPPDMAEFSCSAEKVFAALRELNGLAPLQARLGETIVPVGILMRRSRRIPVVWMLQPADPFEAICLGLKARLGADSLIILLSQTAEQTIGVRQPGDVVVLDIRDDPSGDLALWRALDAIDPTYRRTRIADAAAIFDDLSVEFVTVPGERHVVRINGHDLGGFRQSDLKFTRLLYLAAARAKDPDVEGGGWMEKWRLHGDDKDHDIEALRSELTKSPHPNLTPAELKALIKTSPIRDGRIRLAVHPRRIRFDPSLAELTFVADREARGMKGKKRRTPGAEQLHENRRKGLTIAEKLLKAARETGVLPLISRGWGRSGLGHPGSDAQLHSARPHPLIAEKARIPSRA